MDLILGRFADAAIGDLAETEIGELERLANVPDPELYSWVSGACPVPPAYDIAVFRRLCAFYSLERRA
jgi:antitoxin CptB